MIKRLLFLTALTFTISSNLFAGTTGKLTGKIIDAENGEILPGINILIDGTTMGDASDINGEYLINNIPPGTYTVVASGVGFQKQTFLEVQISADFTTSLDIEMSTESITTETVLVILADSISIQPAASVTVTLYVPVLKLLILCVVAPFDQL